MRENGKTILAAVVLALAGCSGGSAPPAPAGQDTGTSPPNTSNTSNEPPFQSCSNFSRPAVGAESGLPGGFWRGVVSLEPNHTTYGVEGLVTEDGRYWFWEGHDQWVGSFAVSGTTFSGDGVAYSGGEAWSDDSLVTPIDSLEGVFADRETLVADWTMASGNWGCFAVDYDAELYENPSAVADIAGTWQFDDDWGFVWRLTIDTEGYFFLEDPYFCDIAGRIGIIDERFAAYELKDVHEVNDSSAVCTLDAPGYSGLAYTYQSAGLPAENNDVIVLRTHTGQRARSYWFYNRLP